MVLRKKGWVQSSGKIRFVRLAEMEFVTCDGGSIHDEVSEWTSMAYLNYIRQWSDYKVIYLPEQHILVNKVIMCTLKIKQSRKEIEILGETFQQLFPHSIPVCALVHKPNYMRGKPGERPQCLELVTRKKWYSEEGEKTSIATLLPKLQTTWWDMSPSWERERIKFKPYIWNPV